MLKKIHSVKGLCMTMLFVATIGSAETDKTIDYLSFARGAIPVAISGNNDALKTGYEHALSSIDGNSGPFILTPKPGGPDTVTEFIFELPSSTMFSGFAIPNISETPSPSQTFVSRVEVFGSNEGPDTAYALLASTELTTHGEKGQLTEFEATQKLAVRWVKLVLSGGIDVQREKTFFEFSEIQGFGVQEQVAMSERLNGKWKGRGVLMELHQDGALVSGCYDRTGDLRGAVTGNMLYASGVDRNDGVLSTFVLSVAPDGSINGVRSTNGAPFRIYTGGPAPKGTITGCSEPVKSTLGCGAIVYGIQFDFDSADIKSESEQVLSELYKGLSETPSSSIVIEGHTSNEGSEPYNQQLSERRAKSVVEDLITRGLDRGRVTAAGRGESEAIASNENEAGRTLNRRVEVNCASH